MKILEALEIYLDARDQRLKLEMMRIADRTVKDAVDKFDLAARAFVGSPEFGVVFDQATRMLEQAKRELISVFSSLEKDSRCGFVTNAR